MSKITRLNQLTNENSIYRVSGVFGASEICTIKKSYDFGLTIETLLEPKQSLNFDRIWFRFLLGTNNISIMCLQRGMEV